MDFQSQLNNAFQRFEEGNLQEAERIYNFLFAEELSIEQEIRVRFNYGYLLVKQGRLADALNNYQLTLELAHGLGDKELISQSIHQIGMVYRVFGKYDCALDYFQKEKSYIDEHFTEHWLFLAANAYEMGFTNLLSRQFTSAKHHFDWSLKYAQKSEDEIMLACAYRGLGDYSKEISNPEQARKMYNKSSRFFKQADDAIGAEEIAEKLRSLDG